MFTLLETPLQSDDRYREIFARSPLGVALLDEHGLFAEVNPAMCQLLGRPAAELRGRALREFAHPEDLTEPDLSSQLEARYLNPDGEVRWAWSTATAIPGPAGELWTLLHVQDVTDHEAAELALRESAAKLAALASLARCVQMGQDPRPVAVAAARSLAGASTVAMVELSTDILVVTACDGTDLTGVRLPLSGSSAAAEVWRSGAEHLQSDAGEEPPLEPAIRALEDTISTLWEPVIVEGSVIALLVVTWERRVPGLTEEAVQQVREVAAETAMALHATHLRAKLECAASTDPLTGSLNRRAWDTQLLELMAHARSSGQPLTVALVDFDHFKAFNDTFGHTAGDEVLRAFAAEASATLRGGDVFARWGGEEFVLALPDCTPVQVERILQRVQASVPTGCTCSIGATTWNPDEPITTTVSRADAALYDAKRVGRDRRVTR